MTFSFRSPSKVKSFLDGLFFRNTITFSVIFKNGSSKKSLSQSDKELSPDAYKSIVENSNKGKIEKIINNFI